MMKNEVVNQPAPSANQRYLTQNARILKLIQTKMQPLQKSTSMRLLLPKIRPLPSSPRKGKKYVEIEIKDEEDVIVSTEIEQEHKYKMETRRTNYRLNSTKNQQHILSTHAPPRNTESPKLHCDWSFQDGIAREEQRNRERLQRIQQEIDSGKRRFVSTIKLTECAGDFSGKENCSFEYLVNRIEAEREERPTKNAPSSAYEAISPNNLSHYITLLQPPRNLHGANIEEDLQEAAAVEAKPRRHELKKKTTMMASDCHEETEHVASKLRLKANHRKLIEHNR